MKGKQENVQVGFGDLVLVASNLAASHLRPVQRALHPSKPQSQATSMKHQGLAESAKKSLCFPSSPFFVPRPSCSLDVCATWLPHPLPGPTKLNLKAHIFPLISHSTFSAVLNKTDPWALETPFDSGEHMAAQARQVTSFRNSAVFLNKLDSSRSAWQLIK